MIKSVARITFIILSGSLFYYACSKSTETMDAKSLEKKLVEAGYFGLFLQGRNSKADSIWEDGNNLSGIHKIIESPTSSMEGKFLAAEMLRHYQVAFEPQHKEDLIKAYAYALKHTSSESGNPVRLNGNVWGLLYEEDDLGDLGQQMVGFGPAAIPALRELLDDSAGRILYEGSEEALIGNGYRYRIKDFAAFYISKIKNIPMRFHQDPEKRDEEIERLKKLANF